MTREYIHQKNKFEIFFEIELLEPLNIGTGIEDKNDKSSIKILTTGSKNLFNMECNKYGEVYIPGSSIRGVFRSKYSEILESFNKKIEEDTLFGIHDIDNKYFTKSRIHIEDAYLLKENNKSDYEEFNLCTSMKRTKESKGKNIPLYIQAIKEGRKLLTRLKVDNINYNEIFTLLQVFSLSFIDEIRLGSNKSRGFGRVRLNIKDIILEIKDDKEEFLSVDIKKYFDLDLSSSLKVGNGYLKEIYKLKKEYMDFNFNLNNLKNLQNNSFLLHIEEKGCF